ncbi:IgGFc-binding protein [Acidobacteriota bacterium]
MIILSLSLSSRVCLLALLIIMSPVPSEAQCPTNTTWGNYFHLQWPANTLLTANEAAEVAVMTDTPNTVVVLHDRGLCGGPFEYTISPGSPLVFQLCRNLYMGHFYLTDGEQIKDEGFGVGPNPNHEAPKPPVTVVFHSEVPPYDSADAYLAIPDHNLGYQYMAAGYGRGNQPAMWSVSAAEDNTDILYADCDGSNPRSSTAMIIGQTYQFWCQDNKGVDVTGNMVESAGQQTFLLIGGSPSTRVPPERIARDNLLEQIPPLAPTPWVGYQYYTAPFLVESAGPPVVYMEYVLRILSIAGATTVGVTPETGGSVQNSTLNPCPGFPNIFLLNQGDFCDVHVRGGTRVYSPDRWFHLYQYGIGQTLEINHPPDGPVDTDPFQMLVVPVNYWLCHHRFYSFDGYGNKVSVIVPVNAIGTTELDQNPITGTYTILPGSGYAYIVLDVGVGEHTVDGLDYSQQPVPVGVYVHGHRYYGSYGYPAGFAFD